ncbi:Hypothetical protein RG1141_PB01090 (plasmid) [Neorhizobium galegae bv. officinalis bv. officinalis str. HAMBI 1141]|uniref:Uncharacterized protein n=1 Tax=Neorhizobium galegae bv. officinalis bv. officinalis str. HAMBI 1141 TaxID=1028801 RepID=A0A068TJ55_NEOGA|nr:Hypothetical protein RG1141_PB01090 [Neorhizobium galegae bv. officinalis bv. officinalis str. HAMBI 1141]
MSYDNVTSICANSDTPLPGVICNVSALILLLGS